MLSQRKKLSNFLYLIIVSKLNFLVHVSEKTIFHSPNSRDFSYPLVSINKTDSRFWVAYVNQIREVYREVAT